jgi:hypothetical protein
MSPKLAVVNGAILKCDKGAAPSPLTVTTPSLTQIGGMPVATIMDYLTGVNVKPFGACAVTGGPCFPVTPLPWSPGEPSISLVPSIFPILSDASLLPCAVGGIIQVLYAGQFTVFVDSQTTSPDPLDEVLAFALQVLAAIADLLSSFGSLPGGESPADYYQPQFDGEVAGGKFDLFAWDLGGGGGYDPLHPNKRPGGKISIGPEAEAHFLQEKASVRTPGRFNSFMPLSFSNVPFINSDVESTLTATGPSAHGSLGLHNSSLEAGVGFSLVSGSIEQKRKLPVVGDTTVSGEVGLKLDLGFSIGKKTKVKLPLVSFGIGFG